MRFNTTIARVERKEEGAVLWLKEDNSTARAEHCNFLVWAAPAQEFLQVTPAGGRQLTGCRWWRARWRRGRWWRDRGPCPCSPAW